MSLQNLNKWSMKTFLTASIYHIPVYQRDYTWEGDELSDFWNDLEDARNEEGGATHFFGQIVVHYDEEEKRKYIIDGQQRTITSVIFLRALQIICEDIYKDTDSQNAKEIMSDTATLIGTCTALKGNALRLVLSEGDGEWFRDNIQLGRPQVAPKENKKSRERMRKALVFFDQKLRDVFEKSGTKNEDDGLACLYSYYRTFAECFEVLYLEATKLEEAFVIFETLNARGKDLETADLLKNYIFKQSKDVSLCQKKWASMVEALGKADPTKYIRHFWNSSNEFTRNKALYRKISKSKATPKSSRDFLIDLERYAPYYRSMEYPEDNIVFQNEKLISHLKALQILKARSFYPVILAMECADSNYQEDEIALVAKEIETYLFRNITICGKVANQSEVFFAEIAKKIYDGELDATEEICKCIKREMVSDAEFSASFETWTPAKSEKEIVRYVLSRIHGYLEKNHEVNLSEVHVEHIMPQDASLWQVDPTMHDEYLWKLGNLMLLSGKLNISASNKPFPEKKKRYIDSVIKPNEWVAEQTEWGIKEIEERQKQLTQYALSIWVK